MPAELILLGHDALRVDRAFLMGRKCWFWTSLTTSCGREPVDRRSDRRAAWSTLPTREAMHQRAADCEPFGKVQ